MMLNCRTGVGVQVLTPQLGHNQSENTSIDTRTMEPISMVWRLASTTRHCGMVPVEASNGS